MQFEWDPGKAQANLRTHGVGFAEAVTVFDDDFSLTLDETNAVDEPRFATLGLSDQATLLVVVYTFRGRDIIRIISAWKANKRQRELYEEGHS